MAKAAKSRDYGHTVGAALVTGGASGIGRATVDLLIAKGWKVAAFDIDERQLAELAETHDRSKVLLRTGRLDVTDERAVERAVAESAEAFGGLSGVVNSAGIAADKHVFETTPEMFRKILDVNVVGSFMVGKAAARIMKDKGRGSVVNIASISGLRGSKGRSAYGASKGAVINMTQVMANDLAPYGIRVNAVAPGPVETPMVKALHTAADRKLYERFIPMRRYAEPGEIASVIHFLLDPTQSAYVTGEVIAVDGGYRGAGVIVRD
ncbi:MAG TPA: SDR family oxidoreductase [Hyphomicrobiaceae bacterium]|nr:SDR family oxidoreductase [Hyphomicrobiaceae bacterium]